MKNNDDFGIKSRKVDSSDFWWDNGLKLFFQLCGWLAFPVLIAYYLGKWLDDKYQTNPWLFLLCLGIAFCLTCAAILFEVIKYLAQMEEEKKKKNDRKN